MQLEFICNTQELYTVLKNIKPVMPKRPSHPILADVLVTATKGSDGEDDTISFLASDLSLWIVGEIKATVITPGSCCVPFNIFYNQVETNRNANNTCQILVASNEDDTVGELLLTFNSGGYTIKQIKPIDEYPEMPKVHDNQFQLHRDIAMTMVTAYACASKDETKQILTGIQFQVRQYLNKRTILIASTDGFCLYKSELDYDDLTADVLEGDYEINHQITIAGKLMTVLDSLLTPTTENIELCYDENNTAILGENYLIVGRTFAGDYPLFEQIIPNKFNGFDVLVGRKNLLKMSERIGIFARLNMDNKDILNLKLHLDQQSLEMEGDAKIVGNADELLPASISIPQDSLATNKYNSTISVNCPLITKGLKLLQDTDVRLRIEQPHQPICLEPLDNKNKEIYMMMPVQSK